MIPNGMGQGGQEVIQHSGFDDAGVNADFNVYICNVRLSRNKFTQTHGGPVLRFRLNRAPRYVSELR